MARRSIIFILLFVSLSSACRKSGSDSAEVKASEQITADDFQTPFPQSQKKLLDAMFTMRRRVGGYGLSMRLAEIRNTFGVMSTSVPDKPATLLEVFYERVWKRYKSFMPAYTDNRDCPDAHQEIIDLHAANGLEAVHKDAAAYCASHFERFSSEFPTAVVDGVISASNVCEVRYLKHSKRAQTIGEQRFSSFIKTYCNRFSVETFESNFDEVDDHELACTQFDCFRNWAIDYDEALVTHIDTKTPSQIAVERENQALLEFIFSVTVANTIHTYFDTIDSVALRERLKITSIGFSETNRTVFANILKTKDFEKMTFPEFMATMRDLFALAIDPLPETWLGGNILSFSLADIRATQGQTSSPQYNSNETIPPPGLLELLHSLVTAPIIRSIHSKTVNASTAGDERFQRQQNCRQIFDYDSEIAENVCRSISLFSTRRISTLRGKQEWSIDATVASVTHGGHGFLEKNEQLLLRDLAVLAETTAPNSDWPSIRKGLGDGQVVGYSPRHITRINTLLTEADFNDETPLKTRLALLHKIYSLSIVNSTDASVNPSLRHQMQFNRLQENAASTFGMLIDSNHETTHQDGWVSYYALLPFDYFAAHCGKPFIARFSEYVTDFARKNNDRPLASHLIPINKPIPCLSIGTLTTQFDLELVGDPDTQIVFDRIVAAGSVPTALNIGSYVIAKVQINRADDSEVDLGVGLAPPLAVLRPMRDKLYGETHSLSGKAFHFSFFTENGHPTLPFGAVWPKSIDNMVVYRFQKSTQGKFDLYAADIENAVDLDATYYEEANEANGYCIDSRGQPEENTLQRPAQCPFQVQLTGPLFDHQTGSILGLKFNVSTFLSSRSWHHYYLTNDAFKLSFNGGYININAIVQNFVEHCIADPSTGQLKTTDTLCNNIFNYYLDQQLLKKVDDFNCVGDSCRLPSKSLAEKRDWLCQDCQILPKELRNYLNHASFRTQIAVRKPMTPFTAPAADENDEERFSQEHPLFKILFETEADALLSTVFDAHASTVFEGHAEDAYVQTVSENTALDESLPPSTNMDPNPDISATESEVIIDGNQTFANDVDGSLYQSDDERIKRQKNRDRDEVNRDKEPDSVEERVRKRTFHANDLNVTPASKDNRRRDQTALNDSEKSSRSGHTNVQDWDQNLNSLQEKQPYAALPAPERHPPKEVEGCQIKVRKRSTGLFQLLFVLISLLSLRVFCYRQTQSSR